jgi:hypothetical protein
VWQNANPLRGCHTYSFLAALYAVRRLYIYIDEQAIASERPELPACLPAIGPSANANCMKSSDGLKDRAAGVVFRLLLSSPVSTSKQALCERKARVRIPTVLD